MGFRVVIGPCECAEPFRDRIQAAACEQIQAHLRAWKARLPADLTAVPAESFEHLEIEGNHATFGLDKHSLEDGSTLIVFHIFVETWRRPTVLSFGRVGRLYAEGIVVRPHGDVTTAPDEVMWEFR
jgi:hypothetical protein